ncbi:Ankyrin repeat-containing domain [Trinorchestia longiramus]|nr:Ankyrin repeat-containing domain [Trinorchestia longiramus]
MAKTKAGRSRSLSKPRNSISRRNSNPEDGQGNNIENGLYVHSSPPKVVSSDQGSSGSARIREYLRGGNIAGLEEVVLEGQGPKLFSQSSTDPKVRAFLKTLPSFISKIDLVHDAAERGSLRDLKTLLDRRKIARSKDSQGLGLMHKAVLSGNTEMVEYLIETYPETITQTDNERTGEEGGEGWHSQKRQDTVSVSLTGISNASLAEKSDADNFQNGFTSGDETSGSAVNEDINENITKTDHYKPKDMRVKEFNEQLRSDISSVPNPDSFFPDGAQTNRSVSNSLDGIVDWDADEHSYFLSDMFDESNAIEEENVEDLSDDDFKICPLPDNLLTGKEQCTNENSRNIGPTGITSASLDHSDLFSSVMSFTKKLPLPPTASGTRTSNNRIVDDELFKSYMPRRRLSPVFNPRVTNINGTTYEIASPTLVKKLQPLDPKVTLDHSASTGAIRKKANVKKTVKKDKLRSVEDVRVPEKFKIEGSIRPSPRHVAQASHPVVPNSANIRELVQRRNKIVFDFIRREARRSSLSNESDFKPQLKPTSGILKLPILVNEMESAPEIVERPRTPTVMPRSAKERISVSKIKIDGRPVSTMKFKDGAFKGRMKRPKKLNSSSVIPARIEEKPKRKVSNLKKKAEINASLGNLVFDCVKKRYPKDKNTKLGLKGVNVFKNVDTNEVVKSKPVQPSSHIHFNDLPPDLERYCRRLLWSTLAAAQADLGKVFQREIEKELAAEETKQIVYEHDVNYWAKNISDKILDGIVGTTTVTPPPRLKRRKSLKRLSLGDSGIHSGNRSTSTQTSNSSSPKKVIKDANMDEIIAKLEELNVKLESGKPRYRHLVEQELDEQSKLKAFQEHWNNRKSPNQH